MNKLNLKSKPTRFRAAPAKGIADENPVVRDGGEHGAGLIRGLAVVTRGEALGHGLWLDSEFLKQVASNEPDGGLKARFTHPSLSSDGLGKFLGRTKNLRMDGDIVRGDLHLSDTAHEAPDGDLAKYVMDLAESDPAAFATSIVFEHDIGEEDRFASEYKDEDGSFKSPDEDNSKNYRHARLSRLWADDIVDDPAANPGGLFHRGDEIASDADSLLSYALGLSAERPELVQLDIEPDRVSGFVKRFMSEHGLEIVKQESRSMATETTEKPAEETVTAPAPVQLEFKAPDDKARLAALKAAFPKDPGFVLEQFEAGNDLEQAQIQWDRKELAALREEVKTLKSTKSSGAQAVSFGGASETTEGGNFVDQAKKLAKDEKIPVHEAMSRLAKEQPRLHESYVENIPMRRYRREEEPAAASK